MTLSTQNTLIFIKFGVLTFVHLWCSRSKMTGPKMEFMHMPIHQMDTLPDPRMCLSTHLLGFHRNHTCWPSHNRNIVSIIYRPFLTVLVYDTFEALLTLHCGSTMTKLYDEDSQSLLKSTFIQVCYNPYMLFFTQMSSVQ